MINHDSHQQQHGSSPNNVMSTSYMSSSSSVLLQQTPPSPTSVLSSTNTITLSSSSSATTTTANNNNNNNSSNFSNEHQPSPSSSISRIQSTSYNNNNFSNHHTSQQEVFLSSQRMSPVAFDHVLFYHFMEESKRANLLQLMLEGKKASTSTSPRSRINNNLLPRVDNSQANNNDHPLKLNYNNNNNNNNNTEQSWLAFGNVKNNQATCEVAEMLIRYSADTNKRWLFQMATVKAQLHDLSIDEILHHLIWLASSHVPPPSLTRRKNSNKSTLAEQNSNSSTTISNNNSFRRRNSKGNTNPTTTSTVTTKQPDHGSIISQNGNRNNSLYSSSVSSVSSISSCSTDRTLSMLSNASSVMDDDQVSESPNTSESALQSIPLHQNSPSEPVKILRKVVRRVPIVNSQASSPVTPMTPPINSPMSDNGSDYSSSPTVASRPQIVQKVIRKATVTAKVVKKTGLRSPGEATE